MPKYVWITDTHFNVREKTIIADLKKIESILQQESADGLILSGDISIASKLVFQLGMLEQAVKKPIYFTLGNHDFWGAAYDDVDRVMKELTLISPFLKYLPSSEYQQIGATTCLIGANTWYDAILGKSDTFLVMGDWIKMKDYVTAFEGNTLSETVPMTMKQHNAIVEVSRQLSRKAVDQVVKGIKAAMRNNFKNIVIVSHVPPFQEVCMHKENPSDKNYLPWYTSKLLGDAIMIAAKQLPDCNFTVLCGHTHTYCEKRLEKNLLVIAGSGNYDFVEVSGVILA